jgi:hypothetical protein
MLGDAENPAHTDWAARGTKFQGRYEYGSTWLYFIKSAPAQIVRLLRGADHEEDRELAIDFFSIPITGNTSDDGSDGKQDKPDRPKPPGPIRRAPALVRVSRIATGFSVRLTDDGKAKVIGLDARVAYDVRRGNPFKRYATDDFDLAQLQVEVVGATVTKRDGNLLELDVNDPDTFSLQVRGFDEHRDINVDASPRVGT